MFGTGNKHAAGGEAKSRQASVPISKLVVSKYVILGAAVNAGKSRHEPEMSRDDHEISSVLDTSLQREKDSFRSWVV